jgi:signal transduction histidine kinase/DNA-binding response OmpR family regulator
MARRGEELNIVEALAEAGEVGRDLLAVDWASTPLGPPETWPRSLATLVRVVVSSRFSMWMAWGPELTFFCNDAYRRDTLSKKYPWALGRPAGEVWAEIWDDIGPRIETVLRTGVATWDDSLLLFLERSGYVEETYHTFSYSPLTDDDDAIAGMLCVVSEDTERVVGERRMATLRELGSESTTGRDDRAYLNAAARNLERSNHSLPFALVYLRNEDGTAAELASAAGIAPGHPAAPPVISLRDGGAVWPIGQVTGGAPVIVERIDERFDSLPTGAWNDPPATGAVLGLSQPLQPSRPYGYLIVGINRFRPLDQSYLSFLTLIAAQLASGISTTRAYEAERRRAEDLAELDRAKTAFFTNISHELRTPLTLLLGPAEDALGDRHETLSPTNHHRLKIIARNAERLLKLVNTLLDFSRLESGRTTASFEAVDLAQYTAELASMFDSAVKRAGLTFHIDTEALPEPAYIDREMWAKIVLNLLSNALKFTFTGSITVALDAQNGMARLRVIDTGLGIESGEQEKLFERFHRVLDARSRTHEGSGIGLALVAELAELHGGRPSVQSVPGVGTTFTVEIPLGHEHLRPDQLSERPQEISVEREVAGFLAEANRWLRESPPIPSAETAGKTDRPRVLIADDNPDMRDYIATLLGDLYDVRTAPDGQAALELVQADPPDLVLTDVMMPRRDGFGLLEALHADPTTLHVPVVMVSARAGEEGVIEGLEAGADDYLIKPFSARELLARVSANLELDRARRTREQLERSQTLQNEAERLAGVGSWEIDLKTGLVRGSDQLLRMLRVPADEFAASGYDALIGRVIHPDDLEDVRRSLAGSIADRRPFEAEARVVHEDGTVRWVRARGEPLAGEDGQLARLRGYLQDITQRHEAEQAIAAAAAAREAAEREHQIADALQRSLLPARGFESVHLDVATYYQAGVEGTRVGGDWYDAIDLGAGRTALVIGDVAGRGIRAASLMGQLRAAVRAYARLDLPPAEVLEQLDAIVLELSHNQLVTCIYGVYDPAMGELCYANAGHLPPLLVTPGETARRLPEATGPPLGVGAAQFGEQRVMLPSGAVIVMYTDGLVERRDRDLDTGIDALAARVRAGSEPVTSLPASLVDALAPEGSEDDIAILVARISDESVQRQAEIEVPPVGSAVQYGRRFATATLTEWAVPPEIVQDATLIVSELLTNAIVYGTPPIRLRLRKTQEELAIEVDDAASAMPRKLRATPTDLHGRGLAIVADVGSRWAARPDGYGKTVWSTLAIPPTPHQR